MTYIDENSSRADLEIAAIFDCSLPLTVVENATNAELYEMIGAWVEAGDECAAA